MVAGVVALTACRSTSHHSFAQTKSCLSERGFDPDAEDNSPPAPKTLLTILQSGEAVIMYFWRDADEAKYRVNHRDVPTGLDHERHGNVVVVWAGYLPGSVKDKFRDCVT
jgi:hypothetical protein